MFLLDILVIKGPEIEDFLNITLSLEENFSSVWAILWIQTLFTVALRCCSVGGELKENCLQYFQRLYPLRLQFLVTIFPLQFHGDQKRIFSNSSKIHNT